MILSLCALALPLLSWSPLEPAPMPVLTSAEAPADALYRHARDLRYGQKWYQAAQAYRLMIHDYPASSRVVDARYWLASCLEQDQRWDEASEAYTDFLMKHPDQRMFGKEARLNRVRCWGIRQWDNPGAEAGLVSELGGNLEEVRLAAALQLARRKDRRAIPVLQGALQGGPSAEACRLALVAMGVQPQTQGPAQGRFLVVRIKERGKPDVVSIRLTLGLARAVGGYLSDEQLQQARKKGINLDGIMDEALNVPKGTELFSLDDGKSTVTVTVE
ncbi:MAG TPA: tetratricopeptide repeat protein [Geothrix sp.]|nr:tetratricopeptide repeat protein [Geothrix sp.]